MFKAWNSHLRRAVGEALFQRFRDLQRIPLTEAEFWGRMADTAIEKVDAVRAMSDVNPAD